MTSILIPEGFPDWQAVITVMEDKYVNLHFCLILSGGGMAKCLDCVIAVNRDLKIPVFGVQVWVGYPYS